jgi:hypothetical protein
MTSHKTDIFRKHIKEPLEDADPETDQVSEVEGFGKSKVACICPGCGKMHMVKCTCGGRRKIETAGG